MQDRVPEEVVAHETAPSPQTHWFKVLCWTVLVAGLVVAIPFVPWDILPLMALIMLTCPTWTMMQTSCSASFVDYLVPWSIFLGVLAVPGVLIWRARRRKHARAGDRR